MDAWVTQIGGYLQDQVGWDDWAFLTIGGRWDANSAFGADFSTAFYPKVSLSLQPMRAMDMTSETLSTFRLRSAIGQSGLQPGAFDKFTTFSSQGSEVGPGVRPANLGNDALRPEVSDRDRSRHRDGLPERQLVVRGGHLLGPARAPTSWWRASSR